MTVETYTREVHNYCPNTGFCKTCGSHKEYIAYENLLCLSASNSVAITHIRAERIAAELMAKKQISDALDRLREATSEGEPAS
jgi:hypothetical protein